MQSQSPDYYYLRFKITSPTKDILMIRKTITDCLAQSFGSTVASMYLDILWIDDSDDGDGKECVVRTHIMSAFFLLGSALIPYISGYTTGFLIGMPR